MRGKPFAVAIVAFLLVFLGGAAIAGVGTPSPRTVDAPAVQGDDGPDKSTTTTIVEKPDEPREEERTDEPGEEPKEDPERDTTPPRFEIRSPANESHTDDRVIVVSGGVEPGAKVFLGDRRAHVEGDDWRIEVELEKGKNTFRFKAFDEAGNSTVRGLIVYLDVKDEEPRDTTPPRFSITSPANGHETHDKVILVKGGVEPGAKVYYGDRRANVEGDDWRIEVELRNGRNELAFKAIDEAGNKTVRSVTVWYIGDGDTTPPHFTITSPANESETLDKVILVKGGVEPGAKVYYGERAAHVDGDGWKIEVELKEGANLLTFKAFDEAGNKTVRTIYVWYLGDGEPGYEFWASQTYGSCGEEVPYDIFYGDAKPGSVVEIGSEYGSGRVEVGESGHWEVKVFFEGSPFGEPFKVTVYASTGESKQFFFTHTGSGEDH
jgi:hypothetical protein